LFYTYQPIVGNNDRIAFLSQSPPAGNREVIFDQAYLIARGDPGLFTKIANDVIKKDNT